MYPKPRYIASSKCLYFVRGRLLSRVAMAITEILRWHQDRLYNQLRHKKCIFPGFMQPHDGWLIWFPGNSPSDKGTETNLTQP